MSEDLDGKLPKQELLIKILNMTTSDNDNTALVAIRRANEFLGKNNWSWEKLITAKIKIVEDPFKNINVPQSGNFAGVRPNPPPPPPRPAARPTQFTHAYPNTPPPKPQAPPRPQPAPKPRAPLGVSTNIYAGNCWCCGDPVDAKAGWLFDPSDHNTYATNQGKRKVVCHNCHNDPHVSVPSSPAIKRRHAQGKAPSLGDI